MERDPQWGTMVEDYYGTGVTKARGCRTVPVIFILRFYLFIFRERGRGKGEKHQCVVASPAPPTGDLAHNPGMCPDWESTRHLLVFRPALKPLSYTSRGSCW